MVLKHKFIMLFLVSQQSLWPQLEAKYTTFVSQMYLIWTKFSLA